MIIEVTQKDIDNGIRCDIGNCPIALAMTRRFNKRVTIGQSYTLCNDKVVSLPFDARTFILEFDDGKIVQPFTFNIREE